MIEGRISAAVIFALHDRHSLVFRAARPTLFALSPRPILIFYSFTWPDPQLLIFHLARSSPFDLSLGRILSFRSFTWPVPPLLIFHST